MARVAAFLRYWWKPVATGQYHQPEFWFLLRARPLLDARLEVNKTTCPRQSSGRNNVETGDQRRGRKYQDGAVLRPERVDKGAEDT